VWLGAEDDEAAPGPLPQRGQPSEMASWDAWWVASAISMSKPYPSEGWWVEHVGRSQEWTTYRQWAEWIASSAERHYAHGVSCAVAWLHCHVDAGAFTPVRDGDGVLIPPADQEAYRAYSI